MLRQTVERRAEDVLCGTFNRFRALQASMGRNAGECGVWLLGLGGLVKK